MLLIMYSIFLISVITFFMMKISTLVSKKMKMNSNKMTPFECGFNPIFTSRLPFSMRFFLITIIFLIFDVEIALLLPMIYTFLNSKMMMWFMTTIIFLLIILMGLFHEWNQGALNWM